MAFKSGEVISTAKFTTKSGHELSSDIKDLHPDEYMLKTRPASILPQDDCFHKLQCYLKEQAHAKASMCVVSSRFASSKGAISEEQAHPIAGSGFGLFHNGFISNYKELVAESGAPKDLTDTQLIAHLVQR